MTETAPVDVRNSFVRWIAVWLTIGMANLCYHDAFFWDKDGASESLHQLYFMMALGFVTVLFLTRYWLSGSPQDPQLGEWALWAKYFTRFESRFSFVFLVVLGVVIALWSLDPIVIGVVSVIALITVIVDQRTSRDPWIRVISDYLLLLSFLILPIHFNLGGLQIISFVLAANIIVYLLYHLPDLDDEEPTDTPSV